MCSSCLCSCSNHYFLILTSLLSLYFLINWYSSIGGTSFLIAWSRVCLKLSIYSLNGFYNCVHNILNFIFVIKILKAEVEFNMFFLVFFLFFLFFIISIPFFLLYFYCKDWLSPCRTFGFWGNSCFKTEASWKIS